MGLVDDEEVRDPRTDNEHQSPKSQWYECNILTPKSGPRKIAILTGSPSFTVCWECYQTTISPSPLLEFFSIKNLGERQSVSCKLAQFWVRMAWTQLLARGGVVDEPLLGAGVVEAPERRCPNATLDNDRGIKEASTRLWYTIKDPDTGVLLKQWTICGDCHSQLAKTCEAVGKAFTLASTAPARATCDLIPKVGSFRSVVFLKALLECERVTVETGELEIRPLVKFIRRFAGVPQCPRDVPTIAPQKYYHLPGASEYAICQDCYLMVVDKDGKGDALAKEFVLSTKPMARITCQLYSERMRMIWADAAVRCDRNFLLQKLAERREKERNLEVQTARLNTTMNQLQGKYEMLNARSMYERQYAFNEWSSQSMSYAYASAAAMTSSYTYTTLPTPPTYDESQAQNTTNQAMAALQRKGEVATELRNLEREWKRYWE